MNSAACAASAACSISASLASGRPKRMFSRTLAANTTASCGTSAMRARNSAGSASVSLHAVEGHAARQRIVEAQDQMEDRAFAGAGRPDQRELLAGLDRERQAVEHRRFRPRRIGKAHVAERHLAARRLRQRHRLRRRLDLRLDRREFRTAARPRPRPARSRPTPGSVRPSRRRRTPHRARTAPSRPGVMRRPARPARRPTAPPRRWRTPGRSRSRSARRARLGGAARGVIGLLDRGAEARRAPAARW